MTFFSRSLQFLADKFVDNGGVMATAGPSDAQMHSTAVVHVLGTSQMPIVVARDGDIVDDRVNKNGVSFCAWPPSISDTVGMTQ